MEDNPESFAFPPGIWHQVEEVGPGRWMALITHKEAATTTVEDLRRDPALVDRVGPGGVGYGATAAQALREAWVNFELAEEPHLTPSQATIHFRAESVLASEDERAGQYPIFPPQQPQSGWMGQDDAALQAVREMEAARRRFVAEIGGQHAQSFGPPPAGTDRTESDAPDAARLEGRASLQSTGRASMATSPDPQAGTSPSSVTGEVAAKMEGHGGLIADLTEVPGRDPLAQLSPDIVRLIPIDQVLAPVRVEERDGKIALIKNRDDQLLVSEADFSSWREPVLNHIRELLSGDFRQGTNHSRVRDRLIALGDLLSGSIADIKDREFLIGYDVERFGLLLGAYRSDVDDMPALNIAVLNDLGQLHGALIIWIKKLGQWAAFHRQALEDPANEGGADPVLVANATEAVASQMEAQHKYFDPELPNSLRLIVEALRDPFGATKTTVFGAVKSIENIIAFLARTVLTTAADAVKKTGQGISTAVAGALLLTVGGAVLIMAGALPQSWVWLSPFLRAVAKALGQ